jgi:hypothetical protein
VNPITQLQLDDVMEFINVHPQLPMAQWPVERLREWIEFHEAAGSLYLTCADGYLTGLGIGYQVRRSDLDQPWPVATPTGECFYIAQLIADSAEAGIGIWQQWAQRVRGWKALKIYGHRHGKLRRIPMREVDRMVRVWQRGKGAEGKRGWRERVDANGAN